MSDQTSASTEMTNPLAAFGAVEASTITTTLRTPMTEAEIAGFDYAATYFSRHTNRHVMSLNFGTEAEAKRFRAMATVFAETHDLSVGFPKAGPDGDSNYPDHWNVGLNVTFRFAIKRERTAVAETPKPAARKSRRTR